MLAVKDGVCLRVKEAVSCSVAVRHYGPSVAMRPLVLEQLENALKQPLESRLLMLHGVCKVLQLLRLLRQSIHTDLFHNCFFVNVLVFHVTLLYITKNYK